MAAKHMKAMQLLGIKRQFLPKSDIFATMAVRLLDDVRSARPESLCNRAIYRFFPAHNPVQVSAINAGVPSKGGLPPSRSIAILSKSTTSLSSNTSAALPSPLERARARLLSSDLAMGYPHILIEQ